MNTFEKIRTQVKKIPHGKVANYGMIATLCGLRNPRIIGWALRNNQDQSIPCHRVVMKNGSLAPNFSELGWDEQKIRLEMEGVEFKGSYKGIPKVDLEKYMWRN